jgi:hypothetical protein
MGNVVPTTQRQNTGNSFNGVLELNPTEYVSPIKTNKRILAP